MAKLLLPLMFLILLGCQPKKEVYTDVAARASGRYIVQSYAINGDTLYSTKKGINIIGVSEFYVVVDRKGTDSVRVSSMYKLIGDPGSVSSIKEVGVSEINDGFQLSRTLNALSIYESTIVGDSFYERTAKGGFGLVVVPAGYSLKTPASPDQEGVIISAQR